MFSRKPFLKLAFLLAVLSVSLLTAEAATLTGTFTDVPQGSNVDLTTAGSIDWVHWGLYTDTSLTRKAGVVPQIGDITAVHGSNTNAFVFVYQYADNYNGYSWTDGTPETTVNATPTGVWAYGIPNLGTGFEFTVPADTTPRTLQVFVGVFSGKGTFQASLSDNSAAPYTDSQLVNIGNGPGAVYTLTYAANSDGQTLKIHWILTQFAGPGAPQANVTLQAAALSAPGANNPPFAVISSPVNNANISSPASIQIDSAAFDADGTVTKIEFFNGSTKLGEAPNGSSSFTWNSAPLGHHFLTARVTDNQNATRTSPPVDFFVYTSGGTLSGTRAIPARNVDLTAEGTLDWAHWGLTAPTSFNHKSGVAQQISNFVALGTQPIQQYSNNFTAFSWSDGTPVAQAAASTTGLFVTGHTNGFELRVPAETSVRHLKLYVGLYGARGTFQAFLDDASAPAYVDTSLDSIFDDRYAVYTLDYAAASPGHNLIVRYLLMAPYDFDYGNVTWQAATLSGGTTPPMPVTIVNPMRSGSEFSFAFETEANRTYNVQYTISLAPPDWQSLTNFTGNGGSALIIDPAAGDAQRFYRVATQ
jgi:Bacterial Ig domain